MMRRRVDRDHASPEGLDVWHTVDAGHTIGDSGTALVKCPRSRAEPGAKCGPFFLRCRSFDRRERHRSHLSRGTNDSFDLRQNILGGVRISANSSSIFPIHNRELASPGLSSMVLIVSRLVAIADGIVSPPESFLYRRVGRPLTPPVRCVGELQSSLSVRQNGDQAKLSEYSASAMPRGNKNRRAHPLGGLSEAYGGGGKPGGSVYGEPRINEPRRKGARSGKDCEH
jgi:hypothetical protein